MNKAVNALRILTIAVNIGVAALFWSVGNDPEASAKIQDNVLVPGFLIAVSLFLTYHYYNSAAFLYRILEGTPLDHAKVGGKEQWQKFMLDVNKEANRMLREEGLVPFEWLANRVISNSHPLQPLAWLTGALVGMAFVYVGWFWTGLAVTVSIVVDYRSHVYLRANAAKISELMKM